MIPLDLEYTSEVSQLDWEEFNSLIGNKLDELEPGEILDGIEKEIKLS